MKYFSILFLLILACCQSQSEDTDKLKEAKQVQEIDVNLASIEYVILDYDSSHHKFFPSPVTQSTFDENELRLAEYLLRQHVKSYNNKEVRRFDSLTNLHGPIFKKETFVIELEEYKRQFIIVKDSTGNKTAYIQGVCNDLASESWKQKLVFVNGGGKCIFEAIIDMNKEVVVDFDINPAI